MRKMALTLLTTTLIASTAIAGSSIFGHKHKTVNTNGVYSIGVHICGNLECPPVRIVEGKCDKEHMSKHWGVCVCEKGYVAKGNTCEVCEDGTYSDGITGCQACPDKHAATCDSSGVTQSCQTGYYLNGNTCDLISCDEFEGTDISYAGGIAGKANDGITDCHCSNGQVYNSTAGCHPICNSYYLNLCTTSSLCTEASGNWCKYNSTCRESECPNPSDLLDKEDECLAAGYNYHYSSGESGCVAVDVDCEYCNYACGWSHYVKSKEDCPGEMYFTKEACYEAGFFWKCDHCQLFGESGPC